MNPLNLFYENPDPDRWLTFDRYPRRMVRRFARGRPQIGGQQRVFINLCKGLDQAGIPYRTNDYRHAQRHPEEPVGIIGKPHVLDKVEWQNPIVFGAAVFSHPTEDPDLLKRRPVKKILVPGEWMRRMWDPHFGAAVASWPVGINTAEWAPEPVANHAHEFLLYDKVRWDHDRFESALISPIREALRQRSLVFKELRYGFYSEDEFRAQLARSKAMIFICEHETQGLAYQQALSCGVPILAWDQGWCLDPNRFAWGVPDIPATSVPYFDERCGITFQGNEDFAAKLDEFRQSLHDGRFAPREYILDNLTLEQCARRYLEFWSA